jgi:hypothetical protein
MAARLLVAAAAAAAAAAAPAPASREVHVACGRGSDAADGTSRATALASLPAARDAARRVLAAARADGVEPGAPAVTVFVSGVCSLTETLTLDARDSGLGPASPAVWRSAPGDVPGVVSGGVTVTQSWLSPVAPSDPAYNWLPPASRASVQTFSLAAHGIADAGALSCRPYLGGDASILPALMPEAGLELFWLGDPSAGGDASPLTLARFPNRETSILDWTHITAAAGQSIAVEAAMAGRLASWAGQLAADPGSILMHVMNPIGWADFHLPVAALTTANGSVTLGTCENNGYSTLEKDGYLYAYNILAELDEPGEYAIDRATGTVYVWPPTPAYWATTEWGTAVVPPQRVAHAGHDGVAGAVRAAGAGGDDPAVGAVSIVDDLLDIDGVSWLTFDSVTFTFARGIGLNINGATGVTVSNSVVENTGSTAVNITGGSAVTVASSTLRHGGQGGVYMYAGDRPTLTRSGHVVTNSSVSYSHRYVYCYSPLVAQGDCGNSVVDSELFGAPHMGVFMSGNYHALNGSAVHDVVQVVRDSGALYAGRDWTYRGSTIVGNNFSNINTVLPGADVSVVYLDDSVSGFYIAGNTFSQIARAFLLGGGRDNVFINNHIAGADGSDAAIHVDNRDEGWAKSSCEPGGILVQFLGRVPYNTSAAWIAAFPNLPNILADDPCAPKYNAIVDNVVCGSAPGLPWIDVDNATLASWGSTAWGNVNTTTC